MKFNLNKKGFSFSPYLMIVMMLLGIIMAFHFIVVDSEKAVAIASEGKQAKNELQEEEIKSATRNAILLSAYDYIDRGLNRPDLQVTPYVVGKKNPITNKMFTLKDYLERYIKMDLNSVWSESHVGLGYWGDVKINEKDDKGKIRSDGFLVSAEGTNGGVEKFVDSGVLAYYEKYKNYEEDFFTGFTKSLTCKLGASCKSETKWLTKQRIISCSSSEPQDHYRDANEIVKRIKEALTDLAKTEVRGTGSFSGNKVSNAPIVYNVDFIDATVDMKTNEKLGDCCHFIYHDKYNECVDEKYEELWGVSITISGKIHFRELNITADATAKETTDGFEVCVMHTIMTKDGKIKATQASKKDFDVPYAISIYYSTPCEPGPVITRYSKLLEGEVIPNFKMNADSLKYTLTPVKCEWGPSDVYTPACAKAKGALRSEYVRCSKCQNACYYDDNVPNEGDEWYCPGEEDPYYPRD